MPDTWLITQCSFCACTICFLCIFRQKIEKTGILGNLLCLYCCYCSVAVSRPTVCDPMNCNMPGVPVLHYLLEFAQTCVHWVSDAMQPSHPLSPPSPLALNLSQPQGLFHACIRSNCVGNIHCTIESLKILSLSKTK